MSDFKIIKCPSCGSSSVETETESIATCSHCGSKLLLKNRSELRNGSSTKKYTLYVVVIYLFLLFIVKPAWEFLNKNTEAALSSEPLNEKAFVADNNLGTNRTDEKVLSQQKTSQLSIADPKISIMTKTEGKTSNGGVYWIVKIRNESETTVSRPRVIMSLFNTEGQRIDEQTGWAKLEQLSPAQETEVLVFIAKPPKEPYKSEMSAQAKKPSQYERVSEQIEIIDFVIKDNGKNAFTIIGDVVNPYDYQLDFVKIMAVAMDKKGVPVGLADAFASTTNIEAKGQSGFKITAGTFVAQTPASWSLWAKGRKHKK